MNSSQPKKLVIVTGANKGIGLQIVKDVLNLDSSYNILLTSRDVQRGKDALKEVEASHNAKGRLFYEQLDIENEESIEKFAGIIKEKYKSFYSLINNAAVAYEDAKTIEDLSTTRIDEKSVKSCIQINIRGTISLTQKILPYLEEKGRVLFISSLLGLHRFQGEDVVKAHSDSNISEKEFHRLLDEYESAAPKYEHHKLGYHNSIYCDSKLFINTYVRFIVKNYLKKNQTAFALHPGSIKTDMNKYSNTSIENGTVSTLTVLKYDDKTALENNLKFLNDDGNLIDY